MSVLNVDTIANAAGSGPVALTKQSAAKAWGSFNNSGTTINDSFGVSSLDDDGTGDKGVNLSNAMTNANFSTTTNVISNDHSGSNNARYAMCNLKTTSSVDLQSSYIDGAGVFTFYDQAQDVTIHGDLA
jgi:hypothetical protein